MKVRIFTSVWSDTLEKEINMWLSENHVEVRSINMISNQSGHLVAMICYYIQPKTVS